MDQQQLVLGVQWYVVFVASLVCHEAAHALAAKWLGDATAYEGGQVTLNPLPHMQREPFGTVIVPLASYLLGGSMMGWASAPYDPYWAQRYPKRAAIMAAAGPLANLLLVGLAAALIHAGISAGALEQPERVTMSTVVVPTDTARMPGTALELSILFSLNLLLFAFNLIPFPPLDGSSIVQLVLGDDLARRYQNLLRTPALRLAGLVVAVKLFDPVFRPLHVFALNLLYPGSHYH